MQSPPLGNCPIFTMEESSVDTCITISSFFTMSSPYLATSSSCVLSLWKPVATKIRIRASGDTLRILLKRIGVIIFEGTGRVWSELIMTIFFLPLASSSKLFEPIGLFNDCSTISFSESVVL